MGVRSQPCCPTNSSHGCGCSSCEGANLCKPIDDCPPLVRFCCDARIRVPCDAKGVAFGQNMCGGVSELSRLTAWIRRRGTSKWLLSYPAWDVDAASRVEFRFDSKTARLPKGRYELEIRVDKCEPCGRAEIVFDSSCPLDLRDRAFIAATTFTFPAYPGNGANTLFELVAQFSARTCCIIERGTTTVCLTPEDAARLCALVLCHPVEFVLTDGVNSEVVTFTGCTLGVPTIIRGTPQYRFPAGATLVFAWTPNNVQRASTPCPPT